MSVRKAHAYYQDPEGWDPTGGQDSCQEASRREGGRVVFTNWRLTRCFEAKALCTSVQGTSRYAVVVVSRLDVKKKCRMLFTLCKVAEV